MYKVVTMLAEDTWAFKGDGSPLGWDGGEGLMSREDLSWEWKDGSSLDTQSWGHIGDREQAR